MTPEPLNSSYFFRATLLDQLHSGHWQVGERLPTEREWCEQYQISRSTVRKVLAELKVQGLIAQTVGSGTYVTDKVGLATNATKGPVQNMPDAAWQTSPAELMEARMALEPAIIEMVIGNATPADFEQMAQCCDRAEAATSVEEFEVWDGLFHDVIARAAHNGFVASPPSGGWLTSQSTGLCCKPSRPATLCRPRPWPRSTWSMCGAIY
jgi:DNA-binding FadR family transcriptional regulator